MTAVVLLGTGVVGLALCAAWEARCLFLALQDLRRENRWRAAYGMCKLAKLPVNWR